MGHASHASQLGGWQSRQMRQTETSAKVPGFLGMCVLRKADHTQEASVPSCSLLLELRDPCAQQGDLGPATCSQRIGSLQQAPQKSLLKQLTPHCPRCLKHVGICCEDFLDLRMGAGLLNQRWHHSQGTGQWASTLSLNLTELYSLLVEEGSRKDPV